MQEDNTLNAAHTYADRKKRYFHDTQKYTQKINWVSNMRLLCTLIGIVGAIFLYIYNYPVAALIVLMVFSIAFIILVIKHQRLTDKKYFSLALTQINDEAVTRLEGNWNAFEDTGKEFIDEEHPYAQDLNILGQGSLFQWINTTTTFYGRKSLNKILKEPCNEIDLINKRQKAIQELSENLSWRQNLMANGRKIHLENNQKPKFNDPNSLFEWVKEQKNFYLNPWVITGAKILPLITTFLIIASLFSDLSYSFPLIMISLQILILLPGYSSRIKEFGLTTAYNNRLNSYKNMLFLLENKNFYSQLLTELQESLIISDGKTAASKQLTQLERIVNAISHRHSQLYIVFNILFLLDYQWQISLEKWKKQSGDQLKNWLEVLGKIEALSSLSIIPCDNPEWTLPEITEEVKTFKAKNLGHPLLSSYRVCNDIEIVSPLNTLLITGSNMSGKSTLLRTAGINLLLAYIGAPVCAKTFKTSIMNIYTCMQISDNLEKNISSFYAELLRIKSIVKLAEKRPVFFLLDEIFKGTNSRDRHIGAKAVIKKLQKEGAIGLVSTHDLELGALEKEESGVKNFHFREYYDNGELRFDYVLRPGLSPTTNAIYLMKLAGIESIPS